MLLLFPNSTMNFRINCVIIWYLVHLKNVVLDRRRGNIRDSSLVSYGSCQHTNLGYNLRTLMFIDYDVFSYTNQYCSWQRPLTVIWYTLWEPIYLFIKFSFFMKYWNWCPWQHMVICDSLIGDNLSRCTRNSAVLEIFKMTVQ